MREAELGMFHSTKEESSSNLIPELFHLQTRLLSSPENEVVNTGERDDSGD